MTIVYLVATLGFGVLTVSTAMPELLAIQNICLVLFVTSMMDESKNIPK